MSLRDPGGTVVDTGPVKVGSCALTSGMSTISRIACHVAIAHCATLRLAYLMPSIMREASSLVAAELVLQPSAGVHLVDDLSCNY